MNPLTLTLSMILIKLENICFVKSTKILGLSDISSCLSLCNTSATPLILGGHNGHAGFEFID